MKTLTKTVAAVATSTVGALMIAGTANATPETQDFAAQVSGHVQSKHVSYADLNLSSDAGMATLQRRIERAASEVCGSTDYRLAGGRNQARLNAECQEGAISAALGQLPASSVASRS